MAVKQYTGFSSAGPFARDVAAAVMTEVVTGRAIHLRLSGPTYTAHSKRDGTTFGSIGFRLDAVRAEGTSVPVLMYTLAHNVSGTKTELSDAEREAQLRSIGEEITQMARTLSLRRDPLGYIIT